MNKSTIISSSLIGLTVIAGLALTSTHTYADDSVTDTTNITVPVSCSMTGTVNTAHNATLNPGTWSGASGSEYQNGIGKTTLTTFCNDHNGFSVYAIGYTGDDYGTTTLIGNNTNVAIPTKAYESTDTTSNWSMKVTKVTDTSQTFNPNNMTITNSFDSWHAVPDDYAQVAEYKASTGSSTTDTDLGAKLETTYATYISQTQPADTYTGKIKYVMVHPYDATAPQKPADPISQCPTKVPGVTYMQDVTDANLATVLQNMDMNEQYYLRDKRDETPYCVSKLDDGSETGTLWMTQNLRIQGTISADLSNFDGPDFNVSEYDLKTDGTSSGACDSTNSYNNNCSHLPDTTGISDTGLTSEQLGAWYNFASASAGTIVGGDNSINSTQDICPSNWHLPNHSNSNTPGSIDSVANTGSSTAQTAFSLVTGGYYSFGSISDTVRGYWWSSVANGTTGRYRLRSNGRSMDVGNIGLNRFCGLYIRCVRTAN